MANLCATVFLHALILNFTPVNSSEESMLRDLHTLSTTLPGCYSNVEQYYKHAQKGLPPEKRRFLLKSEIYKMENPMFNDSLTFYFQDFTKQSSQPFRSGFYSFSIENKLNIVRMKTLQLKDNAYVFSTFKKSVNFILANNAIGQVLKFLGRQIDGLKTYRACDMFWRRLGENIFAGVTGPLCLGSLGGDQVRIGVAMTLTKDKLLLTESWYKISDGTRITEVKVPYILQKLNISNDPIGQPLHISSTEKMANDIDISKENQYYGTSTHPWTKNGHNSLHKKDSLKNKLRKASKNHDQNTLVEQRILRNFRQVANALSSGFHVYFRVELSACSIPHQVKVDRLSFGGVIKNFVYVRQDGLRNERKDYIFITSHKTVMGNQGPEFITRQLTLLREGRVKVEIIKIFSEPSKVKQMYSFECRLYNDQKGYGGVKLAMDTGSRVKRISSFSSLSSLADHGRDLHIVADLAKCRGFRKKPAVVIGSQVTSYDFVNGGKTVEIFLPFVSSTTPEQAVATKSPQGFLGQILKSGDVVLTLISNGQSNQSLENVFHLSSAYRCTLSNRNDVTTNENNEQSVKMFYSK